MNQLHILGFFLRIYSQKLEYYRVKNNLSLELSL